MKKRGWEVCAAVAPLCVASDAPGLVPDAPGTWVPAFVLKSAVCSFGVALIVFLAGPAAGQQSLPESAPTPPEPAPCAPEPMPARPQPTPASQAAVQALKKEAMEVVGRLRRHFPNSADPLALMGKVHLYLGNSAQAVECWERCLQLEPQPAEVYNSLGMIALQKGECAKAAMLWQKTLDIDPAMPGVHNRLARALMGQGKTKQAIAALQQEIKISPKASENYFLLGQQYLLLEDHQKAKQNYETAIAIEPNLTNAYYGLATVCARLGLRQKSGECREKFKTLKAEDRRVLKAQKLTFDDLDAVRQTVAHTYTDAARIYHKHDFLWKAEKHWQRAAELDPNATECRLELAWLYQKNNRGPEALKIYQQLREIEPDSAIHCLNMGVLYARSRQFGAAEKAFKKTQELAPRRSWGYCGLAQLYLRMNRRLPEAKTFAQKAVELESIAPNYFVLSEACDKSGDPRGALAAIERAVELDPDNARYRRIYELIRRRK